MPCDLVTGEERVSIETNGKQATHVACTVEMSSVTTPCMYTLFKKTVFKKNLNSDEHMKCFYCEKI